MSLIACVSAAVTRLKFFQGFLNQIRIYTHYTLLYIAASSHHVFYNRQHCAQRNALVFNLCCGSMSK